MKTNEISVLRDNLKWLMHDSEASADIRSGIAKQIAQAIKGKYSLPTPEDAFSLYRSVCDGVAGDSLFAEVCRQLKPCDISTQGYCEPKNVTYFRTPMTDRAYKCFANQFPSLRAVYSTDFKSACEDVYYDRSDACILPLESSEDGLITSFRRMLTRYELKIVSKAKIDLQDDGYQTLALLSNDDGDPDGSEFEFCIPSFKSDDATLLFDAIDTMHTRLIRCVTLPSKSSEDSDLHLCVSGQTHSLRTLKFFLDAKFPANITLGQYKNI